MKLKSGKRIIFYVLLFYVFGIDYMYLVFPLLNTFLNSKVLGIILFLLVGIHTFNYKKVTIIPLTIYFVFFLTSLLSYVIQGNHSVVFESVTTLHNLRMIFILPIYMCTLDKSEITTVMYKYSLFSR